MAAAHSGGIFWQLTGAAGPADPDVAGPTPLTLGSVEFRSDECPSKIAFGGAQITAPLIAIGGGRIIQTLGPNPHDVKWTGKLWGDNVQTRVALLHKFWSDGKERLLTYFVEAYYVIVTDFAATYEKRFRASYDITVKVVRDASGNYASSSGPSLDNQTQNLLNTASQNAASLAAMPSLSGVDSTGVSAALSSVSSALAAASPVSSATGSTLASLISAIASALSTVQTAIACVPAGSAIGYILSLGAIRSALVLLQRNASNGQTLRTMRVQGGNCYRLAAQYYGDATLGPALAKANGLVSPFIPQSVVLDLALPPFTASS